MHSVDLVRDTLCAPLAEQHWSPNALDLVFPGLDFVAELNEMRPQNREYLITGQ